MHHCENSRCNDAIGNTALLCLSIGLSATWSCAIASEAGTTVGYIGQYSDNIRLVPTGMEQEWINSAFLGYSYRERDPELAADLSGTIEYRDYTRQTYQDETLFYLSAAGVWTIAPRRFLWTLVDRFDQLPQDTTRAPTPDNREAVNVVDTGPDLLINLNPVNVLVLGMRAGNTWFKQSESDNDRIAAVLSWRYHWDTVTQLSANVEEQQIRYTTVTAAPVVGIGDYHREDYYLRYDRQVPLGRAMVDLGASSIRPDGLVGDRNEPIFRLNLAYRLSPESAVGLSGRHELMSLSSALLADVADPTAPESITAPPSVPLELASGDIYVNRGGEAFYTRRGEFLGAQASVFGRELDYLTTPQDRTEFGGRLQLSYVFTSTLAATAYGSAIHTDYPEIARLDRDINYGLVFAYRLTPNVTFSLEGRRSQRDSSDSTAGYVETRGLAQLVYNTGPLATLPAYR